MSKTQFYDAISFKICLRGSRRADGSSNILLRVIIDRKKRDYNLQQNWPAAFFDQETGTAKPRHKKDLEHDTVNMIIDQARHKAHQVKLTAMARNKTLSHTDFAKEFHNFKSREDFIWFWRKTMNERRRSGDITEGTFRHHKVALDSVLLPYLKNRSLNFDELTPEFLQSFEAHLRKHYMYNTATGHLKKIASYIKLAIQAGIVTDDPFDKYHKLVYRDGFREALEKEELQTLIAMLDKPLLPTIRAVLERFLFSCFTGIRISDTHQVTTGMIHNGTLSLKMKKGERYGKVVHIPLPGVALKLVEGRSGKLFEPMADQTCNDILKIIAGIAGITKRLTYHVSRHTFGTLFIEMGGDPATLRELMGHTSIATTLIYVKISEKRKETLMSNFDKIFGATLPPNP